MTGLMALTACGAGAGAGGATAAPASDEQPASRLDGIIDSGTLQVCTTGDYRPFTYLDPETKEYTGIDIAMVEDLAENLEAEIEWVPTTWKTLMEDFTGGCDIGVGGISVSTARAEQAFYSDPLMEEGKTPITLCENVEKYDTVEEINQPGVRSITPIGGTNEKFAQANYPDGEIIQFEDNNAIFDEIIAGRADVMTTDASETVWVANEKPELCAVHPEDPFDYFEKAYLLPLGDVVLKEYVDQWLNMAKHDGTYEEATKPWFGDTKL
ncbi:transporter substrate-binding domain-containing protein [Kocuria oceani]|uniref:transporter substrate-binding domain-containing protein n=1 Tax=Kocuria oceani TaxID=988827 RepID=UPI004035AEAA